MYLWYSLITSIVVLMVLIEVGVLVHDTVLESPMVVLLQMSERVAKQVELKA